MSATSEHLWQAEIKTHAGVHKHSRELQKRGYYLSAYAAKVTAYFSYATEPVGFLGRVFTFWNFARARHYVHLALEEATQEGLEGLTYEQCNIIGTLLLRKHLWWQPDPLEALNLFHMGLSHITAPPHSRALMLIGCARAHHLLHQDKVSAERMLEALALEDALNEEPDLGYARKQFTRVLRRATELSDLLPSDVEESNRTYNIFCKAYQYAKEWGSQTQRDKLEDTVERLDKKHWVTEQKILSGEELG